MTERTDNLLQDVGDDSPAPLGWPPFEVVSVFKEYITAKAWDGSTGYGDAIEIAKPPKQRQSFIGATTVNYVEATDLVVAAPLLTVVRNDADDADVVCQWLQMPGGLPLPSGQYKVLSIIDADGTIDWDYPRLHP